MTTMSVQEQRLHQGQENMGHVHHDRVHISTPTMNKDGNRAAFQARQQVYVSHEQDKVQPHCDNNYFSEAKSRQQSPQSHHDDVVPPSKAYDCNHDHDHDAARFEQSGSSTTSNRPKAASVNDSDVLKGILSSSCSIDLDSRLDCEEKAQGFVSAVNSYVDELDAETKKGSHQGPDFLSRQVMTLEVQLEEYKQTTTKLETKLSEQKEKLLQTVNRCKKHEGTEAGLRQELRDNEHKLSAAQQEKEVLEKERAALIEKLEEKKLVEAKAQESNAARLEAETQLSSLKRETEVSKKKDEELRAAFTDALSKTCALLDVSFSRSQQLRVFDVSCANDRILSSIRQLQRKEGELQVATQRVRVLSEEKQDLQSKVTAAEREKKLLDIEVQSVKAENTRVQRDLEHSRAQVAAEEKRAESMRASHADAAAAMEGRIGQLQKELAQRNVREHGLGMEISTLKAKKDKLEGRISSLEGSVAEAKADNESLVKAQAEREKHNTRKCLKLAKLNATLASSNKRLWYAVAALIGLQVALLLDSRLFHSLLAYVGGM